jgi:hypothetical protein
MKRQLFIASVVIGALALGCGSKSSDHSASGKGTASGTARAASPGGIAATCVKGKDVCVEYKNSIPELAEEICKGGPDYVWKPGSTPCPTEKLLGKCTTKLTPDETTYWYGGPEEADVDKGLCEVVGQWTAVAATQPARAATGAATSAPTPAKKKKKR